MKKILLIIIYFDQNFMQIKKQSKDGFISKKNVHPVKNDFNIRRS